MKSVTLGALALIAVAISTCARGAELTGIGGCPKPLAPHHKHHSAAPVPLCSCVAEEPRVIVLPAPTADPEPIELNVLRYYIVDSFDPVEEYSKFENIEWPTEPRWIEPPRYYVPPSSVRAPEIDPASGIGAVTILSLILLIVTDRRPRL